MKSVEEFLAHTIQLENEAALRFGQLADAMSTAGNKEVGRLFRRLADYSLLHLGDARARAGFRTLPEMSISDYRWPAKAPKPPPSGPPTPSSASSRPCKWHWTPRALAWTSMLAYWPPPMTQRSSCWPRSLSRKRANTWPN